MSELIFFGGEVKALDDSGRVGGYAVRHKDEAHKDFVGDFFDGETYLGAREGDGCDTLFHHGIPLKKGLEPFADHLFAPMKTKRDEVGLFAETVLDLSDAYEKKVHELIKAGKISFSSGAPAHMVKREKSGHLKRWPIAEISFTPTPCDFENKVYNLKSLDEITFTQLDDSESAPPKVEAKAVDGETLFNESLRQREMRSWELWDALQTAARKVVEGAAAQTVTGVVVDIRGGMEAAVGAFAPRWVDTATQQAEEWLNGDRNETFYLKSVLDELIASTETLVSDVKLEEHSRAVVSALTEFAQKSSALEEPLNVWLKRISDKQEFRRSDPLKAGRMISEVNRQKLQSVLDALNELDSIKEAIGTLLEASDKTQKSSPFTFQLAITEHLNWQATHR